jgi:hypothetical protein
MNIVGAVVPVPGHYCTYSEKDALAMNDELEPGWDASPVADPRL